MERPYLSSDEMVTDEQLANGDFASYMRFMASQPEGFVLSFEDFCRMNEVLGPEYRDLPEDADICF